MPEAAQFSAVYGAPAFFLRKIFSGLRAPWAAVSGGVWKFNAMRNAVRYMKKREAMTRGEAAFRTSFPEPSDSGIFLSQERMCAECNVPRGSAIAPAQWKAKTAAGEWFVCSELKVSRGAGRGICGLRVKKTPCK